MPSAWDGRFRNMYPIDFPDQAGELPLFLALSGNLDRSMRHIWTVPSSPVDHKGVWWSGPESGNGEPGQIEERPC